MNKRRVIIGMVLVIALALQVGCTSKVPGSGEDVGDRAPENEQREIMGEFDRLTGDGAKLEAVVEFINDNIAQVSGKNASVMVDRLEGMQRDNLAALEERFYSDEEIQSTLYDIYKPVRYRHGRRRPGGA